MLDQISPEVLAQNNGPVTIAIRRHPALDLMRRDTSKGSLSITRKSAGRDEGFLRNRLNGVAENGVMCDCPG
jgi:hypothetical protein